MYESSEIKFLKAKVALRERPLAVMALGCGEVTLKSLKDLQGQGILKLFELAKLEFNRIFHEFMAAMRETARSL